MLTEAPLDPAGPLNVRVTVAVPPEATVAGLMPIDESVTVGAGGVTVTDAYWLAPPQLAPTDTVAEAVTTPACTVKLTLLWPEGTR
jgi:hypothetical protein